jgi:hypothetical protein
MFLLAMIGVIVWWRRGWRFGIPAIIAFTPVSILFVQNYGGEAVFRVYLYALPGCAILIAPLLAMAITQHAGHSRRHRLRGWVAATGLAVAGAAGLQSYYGAWFLNVETRSQIALFDKLLAGINGPATLWSLDSTGLLARGTADYVKLAQFDKDYDMQIVDRWPGFAQDFPNAHQFDDLTGVAAEASRKDTYFIFTKQSIDHIEYCNFFTRAAVEEFEDQFRHSKFWTVRLANDRTTVYQFNPNYAVSGSPDG